MNHDTPIRVILADDDELVRDGMAVVLRQTGEFTITATAATGAQALAAVNRQPPDIVLLDIRMPDMDGLECCRLIKRAHPELPVLMVSTFKNDQYLSQALEAGAHGYLLKHQSTDALVLAIHNAVQGNLSFDPGMAASLAVRPAADAERFLRDLPAREREVLQRLAEGYSNKEIAALCHLSAGTVRNYVSSLLQFAHVRDRTQLVIWYYRNLSGSDPEAQ